MKFCGVEMYLMARLTCVFLLLFFDKPVSNGFVTDNCYGLVGGILVVLIRLVTFGASRLDFFFFF